MLANPLRQIATRSMLVALIAMTTGSLFAQNQLTIPTPSQRYQPSPTNVAPPTAHIAPGTAQPLNQASRLRRSLTDSSLQTWRNEPSGQVAQTSFQEPVTNNEPAVPTILAGNQATTKPTANTPTPTPLREISAARSASSAQMEKFAAQVDQLGKDGPQVGPITPRAQFRPQGQTQAQTRVQAPAGQGFKPATKTTESPTLPRVAEIESLQQFSRPQQRTSMQRPQAPMPGVKIPVNPDMSQQAVAIQEATTSKITPRTQRIDRNVMPASRQVAVEDFDQELAAMSIASPGIEVKAFGPQSIGINKPSTFRVVVTNNSRTKAEKVLVGINIPEWVDIENTNLTTGTKEVTDGVDQSRLLWTIDNIPAGQKQTATITTIPRKSEGFMLAVEWTFAPKIGTVNINVTEPRLEMSMSGPGEVLFGETAEYTVTVRNPGTGDAENVVVMLPEEFGGDSAPLGTVAAGKETVFDITLAARTAGPLTLTTSASGDGDLTTSASQDILVRRAIMDIAIEGPTLKYAGTMGRYRVTITNNGDATADKLETAVALPSGAKYLGGIDGAKDKGQGIIWQVGSIEPKGTRTYEIDCELVGAGELKFETGVRQMDGLSNVAEAAAECMTSVETIADLVLSVQDPKGPLPTGEETEYQITVQNRGSRSAKGVELSMQFSEGIEPSKGSGLDHQVVPNGQIIFSPIKQIDPGQSMKFQVSAIAHKSGTHIFRAVLTCDDSGSREISEGTTKFFGEEFKLDSPRKNATAEQESATTGFRR